LEKIDNGSPEPVITIRASLNKISADFDQEYELVMFLAKRRKMRSKESVKIHELDTGQQTLDKVLE
jgi:UTP-glucose-1-phosphate uridylyltransferase